MLQLFPSSSKPASDKAPDLAVPAQEALSASEALRPPVPAPPLPALNTPASAAKPPELAAPVVPTGAQAASNAPSQYDAQEQALRDAGVLDSHIRIAKQRQALTNEPLAEIMRTSEYGFLTPEGVARVQANISNLPYFSPSHIDGIKGREIAQKLSRKNIKVDNTAGMLPIRLNDDVLQLVISDPKNITKANLYYPKFKHEFFVCSERSLQTIFRRVYATSGQDAMDRYNKLRNISLDQEGSDRALRDFLLSVMRHGCYLGASDIAFTPMTSNSGGVVRYKIGGVGTVFTFLESKIWQRLVTHMLSKSGATEKIKQAPVDTRFEFDERDLTEFGEIAQRYGFRVEMLLRKKQETYAITIVMRILDQQAESSELEALAFDRETMTYLKDVKDRSTGLFLITGPTGSGKTTTLYALLNELDPVSRWVESIENPIEYAKGMWIQFQTETGSDEAAAANALLKGLLRAAPDVILFGEVRKGDIAQGLVDAGNTGHLVFSTMHNNSAALAISRLKSFDLDMSALANLLLGVLAQRLIRTLCTCAVEDDRIDTHSLLGNIPYLNKKGQKNTPKKAMGCIECNDTGYRGRRMIYELLKTPPSVKEHIEKGSSPSVIAKEGINPEYTLIANALRLVAQGVTSIDEAKKLGSLEEGTA